ncbi:glycosyltransferase [Hylemonella gracilis]|uniref:glycosyltransferase n=1 Tax=Hylemonella gracilis TaxID=80880 RepID=UPI0018CC4688
MASFNGAEYIRPQIQSILSQLSSSDELVISDDGSTDGTLEIIRGLADERIHLIEGPRRGVAANFECALKHAKGEVIFLSDQDDIWLPGKVIAVQAELDNSDLVLTDCKVVDADLNVQHPSYFQLIDSGPGVLKNLHKNSYQGCCMAMRRSALEIALPFPAGITVHDWWLGLILECTGRVKFIAEPLVLYRRHGANVSITSERSRNPFWLRIYWRMYLVFNLIGRCLRGSNAQMSG